MNLAKAGPRVRLKKRAGDLRGGGVGAPGEGRRGSRWGSTGCCARRWGRKEEEGADRWGRGGREGERAARFAGPAGTGRGVMGRAGQAGPSAGRKGEERKRRWSAGWADGLARAGLLFSFPDFPFSFPFSNQLKSS
jgi:hypothetical protein